MCYSTLNMCSDSIARLREYIFDLDPIIFNLDAITSVKMERFDRGLHNVNYLVTLNNSLDCRFVLRLQPSHQAVRQTITDEAANMKILDGVPAPRLVWTDKPRFLGYPIMILTFLPGEHKDFNTLSTNEVIRLADVIAQIHGITNDEYGLISHSYPTKKGNYADYLRSAIDISITQPIQKANPAIYNNASAVINKSREYLNHMLSQNLAAFTSSSFSLLHTDIGRDNIIWNNEQPSIIDWEEMTFGDPADEVAYVFAINDLNVSAQHIFLERYKTHRTDTTLEVRLPIYILKNRLSDLAWSITKRDRQTLGEEDVLLRKSKELYQEFYDVRLASLSRLVDKLGP